MSRVCAQFDNVLHTNTKFPWSWHRSQDVFSFSAKVRACICLLERAKSPLGRQQTLGGHVATYSRTQNLSEPLPSTDAITKWIKTIFNTTQIYQNYPNGMRSIRPHLVWQRVLMGFLHLQLSSRLISSIFIVLASRPMDRALVWETSQAERHPYSRCQLKLSVPDNTPGGSSPGMPFWCWNNSRTQRWTRVNSNI